MHSIVKQSTPIVNLDFRGKTHIYGMWMYHASFSLANMWVLCWLFLTSNNSPQDRLWVKCDYYFLWKQVWTHRTTAVDQTYICLHLYFLNTFLFKFQSLHFLKPWFHFYLPWMNYIVSLSILLTSAQQNKPKIDTCAKRWQCLTMVQFYSVVKDAVIF